MNLLSAKGREYRRILSSFVLIVLSTGVILTFILFVNFDRIAADLVEEYTVEELSQISQSTTLMFEISKSSILQYDANPAVLQLMNYDNLDTLARNDLLNRISGLIITMPYANSFYVYNKAAGHIYYNNLEFDPGIFPDHDIVRILESKDVRKLTPFARRVPVATDFTSFSYGSSGQKEEVYSFIYYDDIPGRSIVLNVSSGWLKDAIRSMNLSASQEIVILDAQGNVVLGNQQYGYLSNLSKDTVFCEILSSSRDSGVLVRQIAGKKCLVSYVSSEIFGWKYIRITPYSDVQGKLSRVVVTTFLIAVPVILLAIFGAQYFSRRIYAFFNRKVTGLSRQYAAEKDTGYDRRQDFLRRLLENGGECKQTALEFERYRLRLEADGGFRLVLFHIDRLEKYNHTYSAEDRRFFAYGLVNIINELADPVPQHEAVSMGNGFFALLLVETPEETEEVEKKLPPLIEEVQRRAEEYFAFSLTAVVSEPIADSADIPAGYAECRESTNYSLFTGPRAVIHISEVRKIQQKPYQIQVRRIHSLTDNLLLGKQREACQIYDEIVEELRGYSFTALQTTMVQLGLSIKLELEKMNIFSNLRADTFFNLAERIPEMETLDHMKTTYYQLFDNIIAEIHTREKERLKGNGNPLPDQVRRFVEKEYTNFALNTDMVARHVGISTDYLRRQFKKATGSSVAEFINAYRLQMVCEWLRNTDKPINEIALSAGFANISYFYTAFKKAYEVTPGEFRALKRENK